MREPLPEQKPQDRTRNFTEVALGYSKEQAIKEASRCIQCKNPLCVTGCPVEIDIPAFIKLIAQDKPAEALAKIKEKNNLPAVCGRVCPQEDQCEKMCILGRKNKENAIGIGYLERYAADHGNPKSETLNPNKTQIQTHKPRQGKGGCCSSVRQSLPAPGFGEMGYQVTMFESLHEAGGVLSYGIQVEASKSHSKGKEVEYIRSLGLNLRQACL